jgi:hypothetical protein
MKAGTVGAILVLVGGGVLLGVDFAKDKAELAIARTRYDEGKSLLGSGKPKDALKSFTESLGACLSVGGLAGVRGEALDVAGEARVGIRVCEALLAVEAGDAKALAVVDAALEEKGGHGLPKDALESIEAKRLAQLSLDTARQLEKLALEMDHSIAENVGETRADYHELCRKAFVVAAKVAREGNFDWSDAAEQGARRAQARYYVAAAVAANAADQGTKAREFAEQAAKALENDPFQGSDEAASLKKAVRAISAEGNDRAKVNSFEQKVTELAAKVPTRALGTLLPDVLAVTTPELEGGHKAAAELDGKKIVTGQLLEKVKQAATDFQDMVLAVDRGEVKVYVDRTEVTNEAYKKFVDEKKPYTDGRDKTLWGTDEAVAAAADFVDASVSTLGPATWKGGFAAGREKHPVAGVSAVEAGAFARARGKRLPTYDEWLGAAGKTAPSDALYPWGNDWRADGGNVRGQDTMAVGSFPGGASSTNAVDMIGNVKEIVAEGEGRFSTVGGSYQTKPDGATLTARLPASPVARPKDQGFRCARELRWKPGD